MSQQTREAAKETEQHLKTAESYITEAERTSKKTGDKTLIEKVSKIKEVTVEVHKELKKNLEQ